MKALRAHGFDSTNIHQFLSGLTWPSQFATEAKAATLAINLKAGFVHSIGLSVFVSLCAAAILYLHTGSEQFCCICVVHFLGGIAGIVTPFNAEGDRCGGAVSVVFPAGFFHSRIARVHVLVQI